MSANQTQSTMPLLNTPVVDNFGHLTAPWYQFFIDVATKSGGTLPASDSVSLQLIGDEIFAYDSAGGQIGPISFSNTERGQQVLLDPGVSPFIYTAPDNGSLIVTEGTITVQLSRNGVQFWTLSLDGGQVVMLTGDVAVLTWGGSPPSLAWFPGNTG